MKTPKSKQTVSHTRNLTPLERKIHEMAHRHRASHDERMKRLRTLGKRKSVLLAACAAAWLAATGPVALAVPTPAVYSAPALFNEANAAQRAGRLGPAILDYERARLLAPRDPAIAQNLRAAREKAGVSAPSVPLWQRPAHWVTFNCLAALASISLLLFSLLFFGTRLIPTTLRGLSRGVASSLGVIILLAASAIALRWPELNRAVIIGAKPVAHIAPAANAAPFFEVKPGEIVRAEGAYGDFTRIRTADGRTAWVPATQVEKIIPAAS